MNTKKIITYGTLVILLCILFYGLSIYSTVSADIQDPLHSSPSGKTTDGKLLAALEIPSAPQSPDTIKIPDSIVAISSGYVLVVDKSVQKIYVFHKSDAFSKVFEAPCSTGKNPGSKKVAGDAKTPNGIFFATSIIRNPGPPETYGSLAFTLDYPTLSDRRDGKDGNNIWIHGTTKSLLPQQSNGCVVLRDSDVSQLSKFIYLNRTPVIISEAINWVPQNYVPDSKNDLENILTSWNKAFVEKDIKKLDALYFDGTEIKGKKREELHAKIENVKFINKHFALNPRDISILQEGKNAVIMFDQIFAVDGSNAFRGFYNKLILEKIKNAWYVVDDVSISDNAAKHVAAVKTKTMESRYNDDPDEKEVRHLIRRWVKSWESGNMKTYRACYASDFQSKDMDLNAWIAHKLNVREKNKIIRISADGIQISINGNSARASFVQHYHSSSLKSKGKKALELKKIEGQWKIFNEIML